MPENYATTEVSRVPVIVPTPISPQPTYPAITSYKTGQRRAQRPKDYSPGKNVNLELSGQRYVGGKDWAMKSFDNRTDEQFFDSKRLQTIDECAEVRYFLPYEPLNYGTELPELDVVDEIRRLDLHRKESWVERMWYGSKAYLTRVGRGARDLYRHLSPCI